MRVCFVSICCLAAFVRLAAAQTPPKDAPPPIPNRANEVLPSWLNVRGEFRERMEGFSGAGFTTNRDDLYYLSRFRFNAAIKANPALSFLVQVQDARVGNKEVGATGAPFKAGLDLRQGYAEIGRPTARLSMRLGRQEFAFGEQRLVGHVSWLNAARAFDAGRVTSAASD